MKVFGLMRTKRHVGYLNAYYNTWKTPRTMCAIASTFKIDGFQNLPMNCKTFELMQSYFNQLIVVTNIEGKCENFCDKRLQQKLLQDVYEVSRCLLPTKPSEGIGTLDIV